MYESDTIVCISLHSQLHVFLAFVVMMCFLIFVSSLLEFLLVTVTVLGNLNACIVLTFAEKTDSLVGSKIVNVRHGGSVSQPSKYSDLNHVAVVFFN